MAYKHVCPVRCNHWSDRRVSMSPVHTRSNFIMGSFGWTRLISQFTEDSFLDSRWIDYKRMRKKGSHIFVCFHCFYITHPFQVSLCKVCEELEGWNKSICVYVNMLKFLHGLHVWNMCTWWENFLAPVDPASMFHFIPFHLFCFMISFHVAEKPASSPFSLNP